MTSSVGTLVWKLPVGEIAPSVEDILMCLDLELVSIIISDKSVNSLLSLA